MQTRKKGSGGQYTFHNSFISSLTQRIVRFILFEIILWRITFITTKKPLLLQTQNPTLTCFLCLLRQSKMRPIPNWKFLAKNRNSWRNYDHKWPVGLGTVNNTYAYLDINLKIINMQEAYCNFSSTTSSEFSMSSDPLFCLFWEGLLVRAPPPGLPCVLDTDVGGVWKTKQNTTSQNEIL